MLQVYIQDVSGTAELLDYFGFVMHDPDNIGLIPPIAYRLQVFVVLLFVRELESVAVEKLASDTVTHYCVLAFTFSRD